VEKQGFCGVLGSSFVALAVIRCGFGGHQMWIWRSSDVDLVVIICGFGEALMVIKCGFGKAAFGHQLWF
jgi:hypothetical protein